MLQLAQTSLSAPSVAGNHVLYQISKSFYRATSVAPALCVRCVASQSLPQFKLPQLILQGGAIVSWMQLLAALVSRQISREEVLVLFTSPQCTHHAAPDVRG